MCPSRIVVVRLMHPRKHYISQPSGTSNISTNVKIKMTSNPSFVAIPPRKCPFSLSSNSGKRIVSLYPEVILNIGVGTLNSPRCHASRELLISFRRSSRETHIQYTLWSRTAGSLPRAARASLRYPGPNGPSIIPRVHGRFRYRIFRYLNRCVGSVRLCCN